MAKFKNYKMVAHFETWSKSHDDEIYGIVSEDDINEHYFDVLEKDFNTMADLGLVNTEGSYYLLNHPTEEQISEYAERWGILWV